MTSLNPVLQSPAEISVGDFICTLWVTERQNINACKDHQDIHLLHTHESSRAGARGMHTVTLHTATVAQQESKCSEYVTLELQSSSLQDCQSRVSSSQVLGPALYLIYQFIPSLIFCSCSEETSSRATSKGTRVVAGLQVSQHSLLLFIFCNAYKGTEVKVIKYLQSTPNPQGSCSQRMKP